MIDPPRLKVAARHPMSRVLLESAREDHSAPGAAERALQALSLSTSVVATAVAVKASAATSIGGQWVGLIVVKWLGLGLLAGATALLSAQYAMRAVSGRSVIAAAVSAAQPATPIARPTTNATPNADLTPPASAAPISTALPPNEPALHDPARATFAPAPTPRSPEPAAAASAPIDEPAASQLDELKAIRAQLAAPAPARALSLLDAFARRHPDSALAEETAVLRIDALMSLTRNGEARALAEDFLRRYPHSAYAERVRARVQLP